MGFRHHRHRAVVFGGIVEWNPGSQGNAGLNQGKTRLVAMPAIGTATIRRLVLDLVEQYPQLLAATDARQQGAQSRIGGQILEGLTEVAQVVYLEILPAPGLLDPFIVDTGTRGVAFGEDPIELAAQDFEPRSVNQRAAADVAVALVLPPAILFAFRRRDKPLSDNAPYAAFQAAAAFKNQVAKSPARDSVCRIPCVHLVVTPHCCVCVRWYFSGS